ncbi:MAG: hypothetical protein KME13_02195 [Myxacorys californica WJT36-NPBG1]|jgi:hypothetical protein|nr:hypothetical protein [Myxacorys californica WJT36-NPBG1]
MPTLSYTLILPCVLVAMISVMFEIRNALDEFDLERFVLWVWIASAISALPIVL